MTIDEFNNDQIKSTLSVLDEVLEHESDGDHRSTLVQAKTHLVELWGKELQSGSGRVDETDVQHALDVLGRLDVSDEERENYRDEHDGERHPNRIFGYALEFVDNSAKYVNGPLPEPRTWRVEYKTSRVEPPLETREHDYNDEIETEPIIDGIEYSFVRRYTNSDEAVVTIYVEKS